MDERIIKYCQGVLPKQEQDQLLKEAYNDPELKSQIIDYQHLHSMLELVPEKADSLQGREKYRYFRRLVDSQKRKVWLISFGRYAAILVIAFVSAWMLASYYFSGNSMEQQELIAFQQELVVPAGTTCGNHVARRNKSLAECRISIIVSFILYKGAKSLFDWRRFFRCCQK